MAGGQADIGIRVSLEDAAAAGLAAINDALKQMATAARSASQAIQSLSDALSSLNGGAAQEVASAMDAGAIAVDGLEKAEAGLGATGAEAASTQREVAASLQEQAQAAVESASGATVLAAAQRDLLATMQAQVQAVSEDAGATREDEASTLSLADARAQLLATLQAELDFEAKSISMMQDIAAEEKAAATAGDELSASTQTVNDRMVGLNDQGLTQFNVGATAVEGEVRGLVPVLDEAGNSTGAFAYVSGVASERVQALRAQGQQLLASLQGTKDAEDKNSFSLQGMVGDIADAVNQYIALGFVLQMVISALGQFIAQGAAIQDSLNVVQGMTQATDAQMQQWTNTIVGLDNQYGQLETDSISALDLITRGGFEGADATAVLSQAMTLADSTGQTLANTTQAITLAMDIFGLSADQAQQVAVAFYSALSSSTLPLSDYISLLDQSGLTAKQLGLSVTDLITTLGNMGQVMGGSSITVRELQSVLDGLVTFTQLSSTALAALANGFNLTSFAAQNSEGKFLALAEAANGNVSAFNNMVGGAGNAQSALNALDISTKQLAINAANLGLSFNPVQYNAMSAAEKLLYLAQVADFNSTKFTALTKGGVEPATAAFLQLEPAMSAAAQKLSSMTPAFNTAAFNAADLSQKLHMLADYVGGPNSPDFAKFVGGAKNVALAIQIMNQEADKTPGHMQAASTAVVQHGKAWAGMAQQVDGNSKDYQSQLSAMQTAAQRTSQDAAHQAAAMKSAWQQLSNDFVTQFGPAITGVLKNVDQSLTSTGKQGNIAANLFWSPFPGLQNHLQTFFQWVADHFQQTFGKQVPSEIQNGTPAVQNATNQYTQGVSTSMSRGGINWGKILDDFFLHTAPQIFGLGFVQINSVTKNGVDRITYTFGTGGQSWQNVLKSALNGIVAIFDWLRVVLVGASIVPDMVNAITASFSGGGSRWTAVIQSAISNLIAAFSTLPGRAMAWVNSTIAQVLGALGSLGGRMFSSGLNAMGSFASGIAAGAGAAIAQAWNIANAVANILAHHSPPKEGPMKDDDTWMPNMMHMMTQGIEQNIPMFKSAVTGVAASAAGNLASVPQVARMGTAATAFGGAGGAGGNTVVPLVVDGQVLATVVINRLTGHMQMNGLGRAFR